MTLPDISWLAALIGLFYLAAAICIYRILMTYRIAQGALAWR